MRNKLVLLLILILFFIGFVVVKFFILDSQNIFGRLKVIASPTASVFMNNLAVGKTPLDDKYKTGEYILKLIPEGNATDTASWQGKIKIYKNALTFVNRELGSSDVTSAGEIFTVTKMDKPAKNSNYGEVYVETEPQGAIVYLDNDEKGVAPVILGDVLRGDHEISVFMPSFLRRIQKVNVDAGFRVNALIKLAIDQISKQKPAATESAKTKKVFILVKDTPTGFLRVREEPSISASESARVKPGDKFGLLEEKEGWYKIQYEDTKEGWVYSQYAEKKEE